MAGTSASTEQRALSTKLWEHTAHVAALARVIARRITRQNPDAAFLAGIVHEIGSFYLLAQESAHPGLLQSNLECWQGEGEARLGRTILQALEIPPSIVEAAETLWSGFLALPPASLGDTLLLANQIAPVESPIDALDGTDFEGKTIGVNVAKPKADRPAGGYGGGNRGGGYGGGYGNRRY